MEGITVVKRPCEAKLNEERPLKKKATDRPKLSTHAGTVLHGTYSVPKRSLPCGWTQSEWYKSLTVVPRVAPINGQKPEAFSVCTETQDTLELPKFLGLIWLGSPATDNRTLGVLVAFTFNGHLSSTHERPQKTAHDKCVKQLCDTGGALLVLPCGFGKTVVSLAITASLKRKTLVVVTSVELAHQWSERIQQFLGPNLTVGWIQGDTLDTEPVIVIAMLQTLLRRQPDLTMFGTCIIDEAHHVAARSFSQVMPLVPCRYILGLSATPNRKDGLKKVLHWTLGQTAFEAQRDRGMDINVMRCIVTEGKQRVVTYKNGEVGRSKMITFLTQDSSRNEFVVHMLHMVLHKNNQRKVLMLTDRREQVEALKVMITEKWTCGILLGGMKKEAIEVSKEAQVLLSTFHYCSEGFDLPRLDTLFLVSPRTDIEQSVGRVLRQHSDKQKPLILDFVDKFSVFESQGERREKYYKTLYCNIQTFEQCSLLKK